jgi:protein CpxP
MKRFLASAALLVTLAGTAVFAQAPTAQDAPPPPQHHMRHHQPNPARETQHLSRALNLTPDQSAKLEPILANRDQQMSALFQNQQLAPQDRHTQMKAIHQATEQQLAGVLTADQLQQMKAMHHGRRFHGQGGDQAPQAPPAA